MEYAKITIYCPSCGKANKDVLLSGEYDAEGDRTLFRSTGHICLHCRMDLSIFAASDWDYVSIIVNGDYGAPQRHLSACDEHGYDIA